MTEESGTVTGPPFPADAPAPWHLKCEAYALPFRLREPLPQGLYHAVDTPPDGAGYDDFKGGFGMVQIVRYHETPVGPYDELLIIPGAYAVPDFIGGKDKVKKQLRGTRFYVSQRETCYNGRQNWNIPKQLARFEFSEPPATASGKLPRSLKVKVFPFGSDEDAPPFFSCTLSPCRLLPGVPVSTRWIPWKPCLIQPPVGHGLGKGKDPLLCETDHWCVVPVASSVKRMRFMSTKVDAPPEEEKEHGTHWPFVKPFSVGLWLENATLDFPVAEEYKE